MKAIALEGYGKKATLITTRQFSPSAELSKILGGMLCEATCEKGYLSEGDIATTVLHRIAGETEEGLRCELIAISGGLLECYSSGRLSEMRATLALVDSAISATAIR